MEWHALLFQPQMAVSFATLALAVLVGYQNVQLRSQLQPQALSSITLQPASRGDVAAIQPAAAGAFYEKEFGWKQRPVDMGGGRTHTLLERPGVKNPKGDAVSAGGMMKSPPGVPYSFWLAYVAVDSCDKLSERAARLGAKVTVPPTDIPNVGRFSSWLDPQQASIAILQPQMGVEYYEKAAAANGRKSTDFMRLFMVPGMAHCGGGVGPDQYDAVTVVIDWVEKDAAPDALLAKKIVNGQTTRSRPLCPYPQVARYRGQGSIDDAANFECRAP